jgi:hypothetical protein
MLTPFIFKLVFFRLAPPNKMGAKKGSYALQFFKVIFIFGKILGKYTYRSLKKIPNIIFYIVAFDSYLALKYMNLSLSLLRIKFFNKNKERFIVHISVWGEEYSETFLNYLVPSLLSRSNTKISGHEKIKIILGTTRKIRKKIESHKIYSTLTKYYDLDFIIFNDFFLSKILARVMYKESMIYHVLGFMQHFTAKMAIIKECDFIPLFPDFIVEQDFFKKILKFRETHEAVLTNIFRSDIEGIRNFLSGKFDSIDEKKDLTLNVEAQGLVNMQCTFLHQETLNRVISYSKKEIAFTPQLIFKNENCLKIKSFTWTPIVISSQILKGVKLKIFRPIDDYFCREHPNIENSQQILFLENASQLAISELSSPSRTGLPQKSSSQDLDEEFDKWVSSTFLNERALYCLSKTFSYEPTHKLPISYDDLDHTWIEDKIFSAKV